MSSSFPRSGLSLLGPRLLSRKPQAASYAVQSLGLPKPGIAKTFDLWYGQARPYLRLGQAKDEYRMEFLEAWEDVRIPLGEGALNQILETARRASPPQVALRNHLSDPRIVLLVKLCRELQRVNGEEPFYLSVRTVQQLFDVASRK